MNEEAIDNKYGPIVKGYTDKIEALSTIVSKLEQREIELNDKVSNHQANTIQYEKLKVQMIEILKDIETKIAIQGDTTRDMNELIIKKERLTAECNELEVLVNKKKDYISDIESYPPKIDELQKEMEGFLDQHTLNKKNSEQELKNIRDEVLKLYQAISKIIL